MGKLISIIAIFTVTLCFTNSFSQNKNMKKDESIFKHDSIILTPNQITNFLLDSLNKHISKESFEIINDNSILKADNFFNNNSFYAFIAVNDFRFMFYQLIDNQWKQLVVIDSIKDYLGFVIKDINGDNCPDFLLTDFYIYSNKSYKVLLFDCGKNTLNYVSAFDGVFNPFYDDSTKLINSFMFTNHGQIDKETYKINGDSLNLVDKVTLDGIGVEDKENNKFVINHYVNCNNKLKLIKSIELRNFDLATTTFDNLLFIYFIKNNLKQKLLCSKGWVQLGTN